MRHIMKNTNKNNSGKRVLFVTESLGRGGMERVLVDIANVLVKRDFEVTLLCYDPRVDLKNELDERVDYIYKPRKEFKILRKIPYVRRWYKEKKYVWEHRASAKKLYKYYVGKRKFDVEVGFYRGPSIKIVSGSTNKHSKKFAWVHTDFELCNKKGILGWFNNDEEVKAAYGKMDKIVCVSDKAVQSFVNVIGHADKTMRIYNLIHSARILEKSKEECPLEKKRFTIVTVGRLIPDKRFDRLLSATKTLNEEGFEFDVWIVGGGVHECELKSFAKSNELDNVTFVGLSDNPYKYIKEADLFVLTSYREGFALVVPEAMACGLPVLSTACTGPVEILDDGKYGILVENSSEGILNGLRAVLKDKTVLQYYKNKSKERCICFDEDAIIGEIISVFEE